jgi:hypothetical protein
MNHLLGVAATAVEGKHHGRRLLAPWRNMDEVAAASIIDLQLPGVVAGSKGFGGQDNGEGDWEQVHGGNSAAGKPGRILTNPLAWESNVAACDST